MKLFYQLMALSLLLQYSMADSIMNMITDRGYPVEKHYVKTRDNYILGLHRIPKNRGSPVMLFVHGLALDPALFLLPHDDAAGYYFSNVGYDVWFGNLRGNTFSRNHTTLDPNERAFWNYTTHELGVYDLPAMIDYILDHTEQKQLHYIGLSLGGTVIFVLLAELPEYNEKIAMAHPMGGSIVCKYKHPLYPLLSTTVEDLRFAETALETLGFYELLPHRSIFGRFMLLCLLPVFNIMCKMGIFTLLGPTEQFRNEALLHGAGHMPAGAGYKQLLHVFQNNISDNIRKYNYGETKNIEVYGAREPPVYNLTNINTRFHLIYGTNDFLSPRENYPVLASLLRPRAEVVLSEFKGFNHVDLVSGTDVRLVQNRIIEVIKKFQ